MFEVIVHFIVIIICQATFKVIIMSIINRACRYLSVNSRQNPKKLPCNSTQGKFCQSKVAYQRIKNVPQVFTIFIIHHQNLIRGWCYVLLYKYVSVAHVYKHCDGYQSLYHRLTTLSDFPLCQILIVISLYHVLANLSDLSIYERLLRFRCFWLAF